MFMPQMRGFESIRTLHDRAPTVPSIVISGGVFPGLPALGTPGPDFFGPGGHARRDAPPAQALQAVDVAWCRRRMSGAGRTSLQLCPPNCPRSPTRCQNRGGSDNASYVERCFCQLEDRAWMDGTALIAVGGLQKHTAKKVRVGWVANTASRRFKQMGAFNCITVQGPNLRIRVSRRGEPTCRMFSSSMTIQWSARPSRSISCGMISR
jgi:hypothetical protein